MLREEKWRQRSHVIPPCIRLRPCKGQGDRVIGRATRRRYRQVDPWTAEHAQALRGDPCCAPFRPIRAASCSVELGPFHGRFADEVAAQAASSNASCQERPRGLRSSPVSSVFAYGASIATRLAVRGQAPVSAGLPALSAIAHLQRQFRQQPGIVRVMGIAAGPANSVSRASQISSFRCSIIA